MDARLEAILTAILLDIRISRTEERRRELNEGLFRVADNVNDRDPALGAEIKKVAQFLYGADSDADLGF